MESLPPARATLETGLRTSDALPSERSTAEALSAIRAFIEDREPGTTVVISRADLAALRLRPCFLPASPQCALSLDQADDAAGPPCVATQLDRTVYVPNIGSDEHWRASASRCLDLGFHAFVSTPLLASDDGLLGTLCVCYRRPTEFTAARQELLATAADLAAGVLERARRPERRGAD